MDYYLLIHYHPPLIICSEDKKLYYECLEKYDAREELNPLIEFLKYEMEKTWEKVIDRKRMPRKNLEETR